MEAENKTADTEPDLEAVIHVYDFRMYEKYENVQKGVGDMMSGALIEASARTILNQGISQNQRETALRLLKRGKQTVEEIAEDTGLSVGDVEQLAGFQTD